MNTDDARWTGGSSSGWWFLGLLPFLGVLVAAIGSAIAAPGAWVVTGVIALSSRMFSAVQVDITPADVTIKLSPARWRIKRVQTADIDYARRGEYRGVSYGYRGSLALLHRAAFVIRHGEALELFLVGGKQLTITVDDAQAAVNALQRS